MSKKFKVTVLGDGGWGTALALVNERRGNDVLLWSAFSDYAEVLDKKRENVKFLPNIKIPDSMAITADLKRAVSFAEFIVVAIPSQYLRNIMFKLKEFNLSGKIIVSVAKGLEAKTLARPSEIIHSVLGGVNLVVLSGPSHAEEVARNIPTLVVVGSDKPALSEQVQEAFRDLRFRIYVQNDVVGIELCGALKNVIAIGAGLCDGLGLGSNTKAALLSRGLLEMTQLGVRMGANPNTFFGLAGLGDLVTTCISEFGRNLRVGRELGQGRKLKDILSSMEMVAEGVETTRSAYQLVEKYGVTGAIIRETYLLLFEDKDPRQCLEDLLSREAHEEMKQY
ncbi:MAG: glycerol-3-phosphate dehydrogenase [Omnitrophica bacterium RIFCSPLOWO2_12_FULL_50_11]|nr:MAG: glycerol-3-phosphate dehydrogenase [Omnitrophica bacterium RIFCSPLOWO2_12_FULL_50_11]